MELVNFCCRDAAETLVIILLPFAAAAGVHRIALVGLATACLLLVLELVDVDG